MRVSEAMLKAVRSLVVFLDGRFGPGNVFNLLKYVSFY